MTEHEIQNAILRAVGTNPRLRCWRSNTGVARAGGRMVRFGVQGQADLTGIIPVAYVLSCSHCGAAVSSPPLGVRLEIEVKTATGRQSDDQKNYQRMILSQHGIYILARSAEDVTKALLPYGY